MKNLKSIVAVVGTACVFSLAGCEKKDEPGPRDAGTGHPGIVNDTKNITETNKQAATEAAKQAVTDAEEAAKKTAEEAKKAADGH